MTTAIAKKPLRQVKTVHELLINDMAKGQLQAVAAKHMTPERMMRLMANSIRTTPKLAGCQPLSLLGALMTCASLGLEPNTVMGHAYLIPFNNSKKIDGKWVKTLEVQIVIGYKGLIDLARRSGHITSISANIHYSDDDLWDYEEGTEARLRHRPGVLEGDKQHAYAIAQFKDGGHAYVVLPWAHVMKIRDNSQGWKSAVQYGTTEKSPWHTHEDEMAKKTAIRALSKYLPLSTDFRDAYEADGSKAEYSAFAINPEAGLPMGDTIDADAVEPQTKAEKLQALDDDDRAEYEANKAAAIKSKAKPKTKTNAKANPKHNSETGEIDEEPDTSHIEDDAHSGLVNLISNELKDAPDLGAIEAILELYGEQIESTQGTGFYDQIQDAADQRREELS